MSNFLRRQSEAMMKNFDVAGKNPAIDAQRRWRDAVTLVKNRKRRFRMVPDLAERSRAQALRHETQEKLRVAIHVKDAALKFIDAAKKKTRYHVTDDAKRAGFQISPDELASIVRDHDTKNLTDHGGIYGISQKLSVSSENGIKTRSSEKKSKSTTIWCNHCVQFCCFRAEDAFISCNLCGKIVGECLIGSHDFILRRKRKRTPAWKGN